MSFMWTLLPLYSTISDFARLRKVYIVMYFFCIYKISYQVLFGFTIEYVLVRKQFFYEKVSKYHFLAERRDKLLIYNKIEK